MKSDDVIGRVNTYEAIVKGENIPAPGIPESFRVLVKELQALGLDITLYDDADKELEIKEYVEEVNEEEQKLDESELEENNLNTVSDSEWDDGYTSDDDDDYYTDIIDDETDPDALMLAQSEDED